MRLSRVSVVKSVLAFAFSNALVPAADQWPFARASRLVGVWPLPAWLERWDRGGEDPEQLNQKAGCDRDGLDVHSRFLFDGTHVAAIITSKLIGLPSQLSAGANDSFSILQ